MSENLDVVCITRIRIWNPQVLFTHVQTQHHNTSQRCSVLWLYSFANPIEIFSLLLWHEYNTQGTMSLLYIGIIVIASAVIVLGWRTFINNLGDEEFIDFANSQFDSLAMYSGILYTTPFLFPIQVMHDIIARHQRKVVLSFHTFFFFVWLGDISAILWACKLKFWDKSEDVLFKIRCFFLFWIYQWVE